MADVFLHGIETIEQNDGPRPVNTIDTGIIGLTCTAPLADDTLWPKNKPIPIFGYNGTTAGMGSTGTMKDAVEGILDQATRASQTIVVVRVDENADPDIQYSNILGNRTTKTGMHALRDAKGLHNLLPKLLIAPGFTSARPTNGIATVTLTAPGSGYTSAPTVVVNGTGGVGAFAIATINSSGEVDEVVITNPGSGYTAATLSFTGGGGTGAAATVTLASVNNPVVSEMLTLANRFRAGVIADGPNTTSQAAVDYRMGYNTDRMLIIEPFVNVQKSTGIVPQPASARIAGLQARIDYDEGFWHSPSNHVVEGIVGPSRVIEHSLSDPSAESQYLNKNDVACVIRSPSGGYKLWGNHVPHSDSLKAFWSVRRSHDTIIDSIEIAHEPFIDKPFSVQVLLDISETVNGALRRWQALGATLGGRVWLDPSLNTKETWASGHLYVSYDAEGPAPLEHITFMFNRNTGYYETLANNSIREIARMSGRYI